MRRKTLIVCGLLAIVLCVYSIVTLAKKNEITTNALECVCCGGWNVVLTEEVIGERYHTEDRYVGTKTGTCFYCKVARPLDKYNNYRMWYESLHIYHECMDCAWESKGWFAEGDFLREEYRYFYYLCSICGGVN